MPLKTHTEEMPALNMTPMIDVVLVLIIFFMVGTKFSEMEQQIALEVPKVQDKGALSDAPAERVVNVFRDGQVTLDSQTISLDELTSTLSRLRGQYPQLGVVVRGDGETNYQKVAEVFNACRQAGVTQLGMSVRAGPMTR